MTKITAYTSFVIMGKIFGLIPWKNCNKKGLETKILCNTYPGLIALGMIANSVMRTVWSLIFFTFLSLFILLSLIIGTFSSRRSWEEWTRVYEITNTEMKKNFHQSLEPNWRTILFIVFFCLIAPLSNIFHGNFVIYTGIDWLQLLILYMKIFAVCLPIIFSKILVKGFEILNKNSKHLRVDRRFRSVVMVNLVETNAMLYKSLYKNLFEMLVCFNELFGWLIAGCLFEFLIYMCISLNFYTNLDFKEKLNWANVGHFSVAFFNSLVSTALTIIVRFYSSI